MHGTTRILATTAVALTVMATTARAQATGDTTTARVPVCGPATANPSCAEAPRPGTGIFEGIELTRVQQDSADAIRRRYSELRAKLYAEQLPADVHNAQLFGLRARQRSELRKLLRPDQLPRFDANAEAQTKADERSRAEARKSAGER